MSDFSSVRFSQFISSSPALGSTLTVQDLLQILCLSLSPPPPSKINKLVYINVYLFSERVHVGMEEGETKRGTKDLHKCQSRLGTDSSEPPVGLELISYEITTNSERLS